MIRIVVTRPKVQSQGLIEKLKALQSSIGGLDVFSVPLIRIVPPGDDGVALDKAMDHIDEYDWLVFTSANAVAPALGPRAGNLKAQIAVVGEATAEAVIARGGTVGMIAKDGTAASLVDLFPKQKGGKVLFPRSSSALETIPQGLRKKKWTVDSVDAYRTVPADVDENDVVRARMADVIIFASGTAVRAFENHVGAPTTKQTALCIGPETAAIAKKAGFKSIEIAKIHTDDGVVAKTRQLLGAKK